MVFEFFELEQFVQFIVGPGDNEEEKMKRSHTFTAFKTRWCFIENVFVNAADNFCLRIVEQTAICQREILERFVCPSFRLDHPSIHR